MIDADIVRHRAKPNPTTYANWFVQAAPSQRILIGRISAALPAFSASGHAQPIAVKPGRA
jgi:hypothetical protein